MSFDLVAADGYIQQNVVDVDSWNDLDEAGKTRFLNVAKRILAKRFSKLMVPDAAVYLYANELCIAYNDVNKYSASGVQSFSVNGAASFAFFRAGDELGKKIPLIVLDEISEANGGALLYRRAGMAVY